MSYYIHDSILGVCSFMNIHQPENHKNAVLNTRLYIVLFARPLNKSSTHATPTARNCARDQVQRAEVAFNSLIGNRFDRATIMTQSCMTTVHDLS